MELIDLEDFIKLDVRVAKVLSAEKVEDSKKLLKLRISLGDEERTIMAGIAKHYRPEDLIGKKIIVLANLRPRKIFGVESQGMLLAASDGESLSILIPEKDLKEGSKVS